MQVEFVLIVKEMNINHVNYSDYETHDDYYLDNYCGSD